MSNVDRTFEAAPTATGICNVEKNRQAAPVVTRMGNVDGNGFIWRHAGSAGSHRDGCPLRRSQWSGRDVLAAVAAAQQGMDLRESTSNKRSGSLRCFGSTARF